MRRAHKLKACKTAMRQLKAQTLTAKRRGACRTADHIMMKGASGTDIRPAKLRRRSGQGSWRTHTPECLCKTAFSNLHSSIRARAADQSSGSYCLYTTWSIAEVITQATDRSVRELKRPLAHVLASGP